MPGDANFPHFSQTTQERVEYQITALRAVENGEATIATGLTVG